MVITLPWIRRSVAVKSAEVSVSGAIQKEKEVMDNICGSAYVIKCFGEEITLENNQMVYNLLFEFASGGTLADVIEMSHGNGLLEVDLSFNLRSILKGLSHVHKRGYVHCDLKPENILIMPNKNSDGFIAKVGDLGLAKRVKQVKKKDPGRYWRGNPLYFSPEAVISGSDDEGNDDELWMSTDRSSYAFSPWLDRATDARLNEVRIPVRLGLSK
ncbi:mitogen-activated protein kinase kinase kinase 17-like protein [Tanacetum coccineum]